MRRQGLEPRTRRLRGKSGSFADVRGRPPCRPDLGSPSAGVRTRPPTSAGLGTPMGTWGRIRARTDTVYATSLGNLCGYWLRTGRTRSRPGQRRFGTRHRTPMGPHADRRYWHVNGTPPGFAIWPILGPPSVVVPGHPPHLLGSCTRPACPPSEHRRRAEPAS